MNHKQWHLDTPYDSKLFSKNCSPESFELLLNLFKHLDKSADPVLSMLPPGVSPAGAAVAASLFFLPGMKKPPKPHCRIALYPGTHFVNQLKEIKFVAAELWDASTARVKNLGVNFHGRLVQAA